MRGWLRLGLCLALLGASRPSGAQEAPQHEQAALQTAQRLLTLREHMVDSATWRSPREQERATLIDVTRRLVRALPLCEADALADLQARLAPIGWQLEAWALGTTTLWVMHEQQAYGGALVASRCGPARPVFLQAPHGTYDVHTDDIVASAFALSTARVAAFNTSHRYRATADEHPNDALHPADVTRQPASLFQAITLAWAAQDPEVRVLQVHGFAPTTLQADVVLSSGRADRPPRALQALTATTLGLPPDRVRVFGHDTDVLGGTRNAAGQHLASTPQVRFLHLELSRPLRDALQASPDAVVQLFDALTAVPWAP